ncbi:MAG: protein-disulfide isomerase, partial [Alphaproteobacteria bacterium]
MDKRLTRSHLSVNRRQVTNGLVAGGLAAATVLGAVSPALAQQDVAVDKLMAASPLPDITIGSKDAKVTIVEYASMSCP